MPTCSDRDISCNGAVNKENSIREAVTDSLISYLFVTEETGNNDGYWVEKILTASGGKKGDAWCGAMANWPLILNGMKGPQLAVRAAAWFNQEHLVPNNNAKKGDKGSLYNGNRIYHIVTYLEDFDTPGLYAVTGEGNTNSQGSPEGNRAAKRYRLKGTIHSSADWISPQVKDNNLKNR